MVSPREQEKLRAIGYDVGPHIEKGHRFGFTLHGAVVVDEVGEVANYYSELEAWDAAWEHSGTPGGLRATMPDKVRWLCEQGYGFGVHKWNGEFRDDAPGSNLRAESTEGLADAKFQAVP